MDTLYVMMYNVKITYSDNACRVIIRFWCFTRNNNSFQIHIVYEEINSVFEQKFFDAFIYYEILWINKESQNNWLTLKRLQNDKSNILYFEFQLFLNDWQNERNFIFVNSTDKITYNYCYNNYYNDNYFNLNFYSRLQYSNKLNY